MSNSLCISLLGLLIAVILLDGKAYADTFEFLTYTPPRGWTKQALRDGTVYRRPSGIGLITFYPSQPATGSAGDEFVKMWRAQVEPAVPGAAPQPQIHGDGDYTLAIGERQINTQETSVGSAVYANRGFTLIDAVLITRFLQDGLKPRVVADKVVPGKIPDAEEYGISFPQ